LLGDDVDSYRAHAGYRLYSAAGVDAGVVGNHDFDQGVALLAHAIERDARFPLLSANLTAPSLADRLHPAVLLVVKGLRVGLVGLTTPAEVKHKGQAGLRVTHPLIAAQNLLPALRPLCDVLIILSHLGHSLRATTAPTRDAGDVELASSMAPGIVHLIIGAHTHTALNETGLEIDNVVNNIPIVEAGPMGRYLGEVELIVDERAAVTSVRLSSTADLPADYDFERREVWPLLDQLEPILARPLGRVADHPDLRTAAVRNRFAAGESALANLIADALVARCRAAGYPVDLAAIDASSAYHGLPAGGELTFGDWFQVMPFADTIRICPVTGEELAALLNDNARRADRPGEPHVERGFLHFSREVRYTIEQGPGRRTTRAVDVTVDGQSLEGQQTRTFLVACTNFLREHAAPWEHHAADELDLPLVDTLGPSHSVACSTETDLMVRDALIDHITAHGGVTEEAGARRDGRLRVVSS
jgi:2',3'-cyclic-nucleotide 2'-phosphodiesterase (5'-nucleotidase family)